MHTLSKRYEDSFGRTVRTYQNGMYTDMTYNMQGDMVTKLFLGNDPDPVKGILDVYVYDDNGNLTDIITNPGYQQKEGTTGFFIAEDSIRTSAEYDKGGNIIGAEDNILTTARFEGDVTSFYSYTKDLRESTINLIGSDGSALVSYE